MGLDVECLSTVSEHSLSRTEEVKAGPEKGGRHSGGLECAKLVSETFIIKVVPSRSYHKHRLSLDEEQV